MILRNLFLGIILAASLVQCTTTRPKPAPASTTTSPAARQPAGSWTESLTYYAFLDGAFVETELDRKPAYREGDFEFLKRGYRRLQSRDQGRKSGKSPLRYADAVSAGIGVGNAGMRECENAGMREWADVRRIFHSNVKKLNYRVGMHYSAVLVLN